MTRVGVLYRLPTVVVVDLESARVEQVFVGGEIRLNAWAGAYAEEAGGSLRGADQDEIERALRIAIETPWPELRIGPGEEGDEDAERTKARGASRAA